MVGHTAAAREEHLARVFHNWELVAQLRVAAAELLKARVPDGSAGSFEQSVAHTVTHLCDILQIALRAEQDQGSDMAHWKPSDVVRLEEAVARAAGSLPKLVQQLHTLDRRGK